MPLSELTRESVLTAMAEYDRLGRDAFLDRYGFRKARGYYVLHEGKRYDSKAIAGAAHGYIGPTSQPLSWGDFSGGADTVKPTLERLGFLVAVDRNPPWSRDELILALELYLSTKGAALSHDSPSVSALSDTLNRLARRLGHEGTATYRNSNGVYMKLMNFRRFDPQATGEGLQRGNADEQVVWDLYAGDPQKLAAVADAIRSAIDSPLPLAPAADDEDEYEAAEGGLLTRLHRTYERDRKLVSKRKAQAEKLGAITCEACGFDFGARYGAHGAGYMEAHHRQPVHTLAGGLTRVSDLALVCANCHRMIHRRRPWLTIEELRQLLGPNA